MRRPKQMTKLVTAGAVLVLAIVFGFIFWNQFSSNQQQLAGGNSPYSKNDTQQNSIPKNDNLDLIDTDLNSSNINSIDSDSGQMDAQLKSF
jgi:predicted PurR-regulated permease PerM